jgi:putative nucleotidyltransferase with HDIG domain
MKTMGLGPRLPQELKAYATEKLLLGRPNWDLPHTRSVAYYAYRITRSLPEGWVDPMTVITAAVLHDIGYSGMFDSNIRGSLDLVRGAKKLHMERGAQMAEEFLRRPDVAAYYTDQQRQDIPAIIAIHDDLKQVAALDSLNTRVVVESDTLGALDTRIATPTFTGEEGLNHIESLQRKRVPVFVTDLGRLYLDALLPQSIRYFEERLIPTGGLISE